MSDDSAGMATGSDVGAPGEHRPPEPLAGDELRLLADLEDSSDRADREHESPEVERAVEDDTPLPSARGTAGGPADPDSAVFTEPPARP